MLSQVRDGSLKQGGALGNEKATDTESFRW